MVNVSIQFTRFSAFYSPLIATVSGGFLEQEGLAGDLTVAEYGVSALQALLRGEVDLVQSAPSQAFAAAQKGDMPSALHFAQINNTDGFFLVGRTPEPDFEIKDTDISFSHTSAWITARGDSQLITVYAKVRNNGGNVDVAGNTATTVDVLFTVDGATVDVKYLATLNHGSEVTVSASFKPSRAHSDTESGLPVEVRVDQFNNLDGREPKDKAILESDETNNEASTTFKVVRIKTANPSFYLGFTALTASVGAAVLLSRYYRSEEDEE